MSPPTEFPPPPVSSFVELVQSRRVWLDEVLIPWCRTARRRDLLLAEQAWPDLAGRPDPGMTLWLWAWQRFPVLAEAGLTALNETWPVTVLLHDGTAATGFPDARQSAQGQLVLVAAQGAVLGPFSIDDIAEIERAEFPE
ncbi:hypothetical protein [Planctomicrobium piriforme]|uniref:Uncharacterized protein n=1 Tax=Planctomicrobium piriforme TaxID=1576369 RepID=A0A1I3C588_9PLAN|nr:hypothetical protein [Planctomicrobium piriforme]SFH69486.1 hypothetical protein SAMN05421753_102103 [Planctomicrobium piriforme]